MYVQETTCSSCAFYTPLRLVLVWLCFQVPVYGHVQCGGCSIMLMYPLGAQSVKCSVCHWVTNISQQASWGAGGAGQQQQPEQQPPTSLPATVVVENPPSLDEQGNEVRGEVMGGDAWLRRAEVWPQGGINQVAALCYTAVQQQSNLYACRAICWQLGCSITERPCLRG